MMHMDMLRSLYLEHPTMFLSATLHSALEILMDWLVVSPTSGVDHIRPIYIECFPRTHPSAYGWIIPPSKYYTVGVRWHAVALEWHIIQEADL